MFNSLISVGETEEKEKEEKPRVICPKCGEGFPSEDALKAHELIAHKEEGIEVKTLKELEEPEEPEEPEKPEEPEPAPKGDEVDTGLGAVPPEGVTSAESPGKEEALVPTIEVSEKDYKLAKDLVGFLVPASLDSLKVELESTVEGDAMALLTKMKADGFIEIKKGNVQRV